MFVNREAICHTRDVIANSALESTLGDKFLDRFRQGGRGSLVHRKNVRDDAFRLDRHAYDTMMTIESEPQGCRAVPGHIPGHQRYHSLFRV